MSPRDSRTSRRPSGIRSILSKAGQAPATALWEALEGRVMLALDHPSFEDVFNTTSPAPVQSAPIDGSGLAGILTQNGETDVMAFSVLADDFVRVWADSLNPGSTLDSRVEIYTASGPDNVPTLVASGSNNGTLTSGVVTDGWIGFKAVAGTQYYVVIRSDVLSGTGSAGAYTVRVNGATTPGSAFDADGLAEDSGTIAIRGGDQVFRYTTGAGDQFISAATFAAMADPSDLDARIDVYDENGVRIGGDSDTGTLTDSFLVGPSGPGQTFYIRVRSDKIADVPTATGAFNVRMDAIASSVPLDPVTRLGSADGFLGSEIVSDFYQFQALGTGLTVIGLTPTPLPPLGDSALRIYNSQGVLQGFNETPQATSRLFVMLQGGETYYFVVENFNGDGGGSYHIDVESNHTYVPSQDIDDHQSTPAGYDPDDAPAFGTPGWFDVYHDFDKATPIVWADPDLVPVPDPNVFQGLPDPFADHSLVRVGHAMGRIHDFGDTDLFQFVPPVDMLGDYAGNENPNIEDPDAQWSTLHRPSTRLQILTQMLGTGDSFVNTTVRVFDSNFELVYDSNDAVVAGLGDPAGMLDPAYFPPEVSPIVYGWTWTAGQPAGITVWGGETYYLEVSGAGRGRYDVEIMVDAEEDDPTVSTFDPTLPGEGQFADAYELGVDETTGEARNYINAAGGTIVEAPPGSGNFVLTNGEGFDHLLGRAYAMDFTLEDLEVPDPPEPPPPVGTGAGVGPGLAGQPGSRGRTILQSSDFAQITSVDDKDLYMFRALYSGYAEIWINTSQITDEFLEGQANTEDGDPMTPPETGTTVRTKTYNSQLDSAIRVFDNDFQEIGYNNDNGVTAGEATTRVVGDFGARTFFRRDGRVVVPVESGRNYFIQVESGQLPAFLSDPGMIDHRHATGTYELLVNSMSDLQFADDHIDWPEAGLNAFVQEQATPMPLDLSVTNTTDPISLVVGRIENAFPEVDTDVFTFISPTTGSGTITVSTADSFSRTVSIYDAAGNLWASATAAGTDDASVTFLANQGARFYVVVDGNGENGDYSVSLSGLPYVDDYADEGRWTDAFAIDKDLYDFDGTETVSGAIETRGDSDVFSFEAIDFDTATITITALDSGLTPKVDIYEVSEDPDGNPIFLRIARGPDAAPGTVSFSVTAPPRTSGSTGATYNSYFVVVSGVSPDIHSGRYELTLDLTQTTDDHADADQWDFPSSIPLAADGTGLIDGNIEESGDTDLFTFTANAQGQVTITVTGETTQRPVIRVFTSSQTPVTDINTLGQVVTGPDEAGSIAQFSFTATRGQSYFILVAGASGVSSTETGEYQVALSAPVSDDHANVDEFPFATPITISTFSGTGSDTGTLEVGTDSDIFTFTSIAAGDVTISVTVPGNTFRAFLRLFDETQSEIGFAINDGGPGDEDGVRNGRVVRTIAGTAVGEQFYLLVSSDQTEPGVTGPYSVFVDGEQPPQGDDDHPNAGFWGEATPIQLSTLTGDAEMAGEINTGIDTDLFTFNSIAGSVGKPRKAFVQVVTASGEPIDVGVTIFRGDTHELVQSSDTGTAGSNASAEFEITGVNDQYWVLVNPVNGITGEYTVRIDTAPATFTLYYPEGFASPNVKEYVSLGNPSLTEDVTYTIRLRYEDASLGETVVASNVVIPKNTRGGITISDGVNGRLPGVPVNKPYAIIIESDGFLAANLSHYDFANTLGEAFTSEPSDTWSFAKGTKFPGQVNDFLVYYNPNATQVRVTLTAYSPDGTSVAMAQVIDGFRRGGWSFNDTALLPTGDFAFTVTSEPVNAGDEHVGVVAALSHYDLANQTGYGVLGNNDGGATSGIVPQLLTRENPTANSEITLFNSGDQTATIGLIGRYIGTNLPNLTRTVTLEPKQSLTLTGTELGLTDNQVLGLRYDSNVPITVIGGTRQFGATDSTQASTEAATSWFWGDAFMNRFHAGSLYFEDMYFYNPTTDALPITLNFQFNTGETSSYTFVVAPKDFATVALHDLPAVLDHRVFNWFSIEATAAQPFVAKLTHYDLVLNGGWGSKGAPLGLTTPIASI